MERKVLLTEKSRVAGEENFLNF